MTDTALASLADEEQYQQSSKHQNKLFFKKTILRYFWFEINHFHEPVYLHFGLFVYLHFFVFVYTFEYILYLSVCLNGLSNMILIVNDWHCSSLPCRWATILSIFKLPKIFVSSSTCEILLVSHKSFSFFRRIPGNALKFKVMASQNTKTRSWQMQPAIFTTCHFYNLPFSCNPGIWEFYYMTFKCSKGGKEPLMSTNNCFKHIASLPGAVQIDIFDTN